MYLDEWTRLDLISHDSVGTQLSATMCVCVWS